MIELKNITKIYGNKNLKYYALKSVNLKIAKGEMVAITGASGSGKSTLLNIIGCLDNPTDGDYILNKNNINNFSKKHLARIRNIEFGFIFQNFSLLSDYNALENVELSLQYNKLYKKNDYTRKKRREIALDALERVGIGSLYNKQPYQLSGGQQQRVAIARALVTNPSVLLADEPTGSLDKKNGKSVLNLLKDINNKGKTIIIVTHDEHIAKMCSKNIILSDGIITDIISKNNK